MAAKPSGPSRKASADERIDAQVIIRDPKPTWTAPVVTMAAGVVLIPYIKVRSGREPLKAVRLPTFRTISPSEIAEALRRRLELYGDRRGL